MKGSIDLSQGRRYKKILLCNDLNQNEEIDNEEFTSLSIVNDGNNTSNKKIAPVCHSSNPSLTMTRKEIKNVMNSEKSNINTEEKMPKRNLKNTWVKNPKINLSKLNKKLIYVKKIKEENINKTENSMNEVDKDKNELNSKVLYTENNEIKSNILDNDNFNDKEQKKIINEIKESVICYICLTKIKSPKICPNCHKIACEKCLKNWFIDKGNNNCGYCRAVLTFDKMISIPIINDVANLIDKISSKKITKKLGMNFAKFKKTKNIFGNLSNEINNNNNLSDIINTGDISEKSIKVGNLENIKNQKNQIYLNKQKSLVSRSTHGPYIDMIDNENEHNSKNVEFCKKHLDQPLFYYCLDCNQAYCRTCFVFFGEEKDKHNNHSIIEYEKYKSNNLSKIIKIANNLEDKYEELKAYIKRCEALKSCYEFERKSVKEHVKKLMDNFNSKIDENIKILDDIIKNYNSYLSEIENGQKEVQQFYTKIDNIESKQNEYKLIEKLTNICKIKYHNSKEIDGYSDISKNIALNFYETKLKKYEIKQKNYHYKIPLDDSKYQLSIMNKGNEVQIYVYWPLDNNLKDINEMEKEKKGLLPIVFLRRKNKNWEYFKLEEFLTYKGNNYFIKRFPANSFCSINSYFKIKGLLYETNID